MGATTGPAVRWCAALGLGAVWWWAVLRLVFSRDAGVLEGAITAGGWGVSVLPVHCVPKGEGKAAGKGAGRAAAVAVDGGDDEGAARTANAEGVAAGGVAAGGVTVEGVAAEGDTGADGVDAAV
ncbi:hypothetical protein GTY75_14650 [Streptomyces sp. SID8381]|uniref:hypothetical protein n=1 Tax=Streptomyces sp. Amel2xE9 TaxID=1157634 RepID=UPI000488FE0A|nr:hypothetical protein [Streptomyces sp. SID8381]